MSIYIPQQMVGILQWKCCEDGTRSCGKHHKHGIHLCRNSKEVVWKSCQWLQSVSVRILSSCSVKCLMELQNTVVDSWSSATVLQHFLVLLLKTNTMPRHCSTEHIAGQFYCMGQQWKQHKMGWMKMEKLEWQQVGGSQSVYKSTWEERKVSNKCIAVRKVATPLRELTCHMG